MTSHLQVQEGTGPVVVTECLCDPRCEEGCCAVRVAIDSDDGSDSDTADEDSPLLVCRPTEASLVCPLSTSTSHSAPTVFSSSVSTVHIPRIVYCAVVIAPLIISRQVGMTLFAVRVT